MGAETASSPRYLERGAGRFQCDVDAVKQGLLENGLVEGRDYVLDVHWAEGDYTRFPEFLREVMARNPSAILVTTIAAVRAAQRATATIPIVMTTINDPVGSGLIESLGRPAGNTTGREVRMHCLSYLISHSSICASASQHWLLSAGCLSFRPSLNSLTSVPWSVMDRPGSTFIGARPTT
jgi:ABC transporter substrate binding protein